MADFGATKITGSGIYVFKTGDDSFTIKRVVCSPVTGKINVTCDNEKYLPEGEITKDSDIIAGKVIGIFSYV
ncbi:MAG: hypothetical protein BWY78_00971 [Alphaproteobacteria bacterium ADurb.Bin438]|nr:MAG: hypothetical protein BWY78_00971 [Alphaproteobacteria bacterium ADurb.Bin438]